MRSFVLASLVLLLAACESSAKDGEPKAKPAQDAPMGWPRELTAKDHTLILYQPQIDRWDNWLRLRASLAVSVTKKGSKETHYGVIEMSAKTVTDVEERKVLIKAPRIENIRFPAADEEQIDKLKRFVTAHFAGQSHVVALDRLLAGVERGKQIQRTVDVNLEPPAIYFSNTPAFLVQFMGDPVLKEVKGTNLLFAVNTNWDVFLEKGTSKYFLLVDGAWLTAPAATGPWALAAAPPADLNKLPRGKNWDDVRKSLPGKQLKQPPKIFTSVRPAELIVTEGDPQFTPIKGTQLLYVPNTEGDVFMNTVDGMAYVLLAGRWFRSKQLAGPWSAASKDLPKDFAKIPDDHKKASVLASVPGTEDAKEAVIQASIPKQATVSKNAKLSVAYDGDPQFVAIEGTKTVYFCVNTTYTVFRVEQRYYCCHKAVWFEATKPRGKWAVCTKVPKVIYTIPSTHATHNVTYVYIYDSTPTTVVVGYTSGYSGAYVAATGMLMFGMGLWIGHHNYHGYHHYHFHSHYYGYGCGAHYNHYSGGYYRASSHYYGPYGGAGRGAVYNPHTGAWGRSAYAYGPRGSAFARSGYNPHTGVRGGQVRAKTPYGSWGRSAVTRGNEWARAGHRSGPRGTVGGVKTSRGTGAVAGKGRYGNGFGVVKGKNNVYVGRDGNVYKRSSGGNWQQRNKSGWNKSSGSARNRSQLNRQSTARQRGTTRTRNYNRSRSSGARRSGGGRRR